MMFPLPEEQRLTFQSPCARQGEQVKQREMNRRTEVKRFRQCLFSDIIEAVSAKLPLLRLCHLTTPSATPSISTGLSAQFKHSTYQAANSLLSHTAHISFNFLQGKFATGDIFFVKLQVLFPTKVVFTVI